MHHAAMQVDWVKENVMETLARSFRDGTLNSPIPLPPAEPEAEIAMPPQPTLSILGWNSKSKTASGVATLKTPDRILQTWHDHTAWGGKFQEVLKTMRETHPLDLAPTATESNTKKRGADPSSATAGPAVKIRKGESGQLNLDPPASCVSSALPDAAPLVHQVPLTAAKHVNIIITVGNRIFFQNTSKEPVLLRKGLTIAGFYKGKWWSSGKGQQEIEGKDIRFELQNADNMVLLGNQYTSLQDVVQAKRASSPANAHVGFHDMTDQPKDGNASFFTLTLKTKGSVYFRFEDTPAKTEDGKVKVASQNIAGVIPVACWQTWATELVWSVRWPPTESKGLQPVRPYICMAATKTLPAESVVELKEIQVKEESKTEKMEE